MIYLGDERIMKKILFVFMAMFAVLGVISCNGKDGEDTTQILTAAESLDMPVNLSINETTKTLSWDAVDNADAYAVYVNGALEEEVNGTSFDFSDVSGDRIVFTVKALSDGEYQSSSMSTTIAFVANKEAVVLALRTAMEANGMDMADPDAFAEELANKGMTAQDLDDMMDTMDSMGAVEEMDDLSDIYGLIDSSMDDMDLEMIEALISSMIKVELPVQLQLQLDQLEAMDGECAYTAWNSTECYRYYDYTQQIDQLQGLLTFIEENGDQAVRSAMIVVEYVMTVQDGIETDIINNMESIVETDEPNAATITMMLTVKNDLVTLLKNNLPSVDDFTMMNTTMMALSQALSQESMDISYLSIPKQSAAMHTSMELFFDFLLEIDEDYMTAMVDLMMDDSMDNAKAFVKANLALVDRYLENNQTTFEQLDNLYTDEEKEAMYTELMISSTINTVLNMSLILVGNTSSDIDVSDVRNIVETYADFESMMIISDMMNENMDQLLDDIIASDYAIIDSMFDLIAISNQSSSSYQYLDNDDDNGDGYNFYIERTIEPGDYELFINAYSSSGVYGLVVTLDGGALINTNVDLEDNREYFVNFTVEEETELVAYSTGNVDTYAYLAWREISNANEELDEADVMTTFISDLMDLVNPMIQDMTDEEYQAFIETIYSNLMIQMMVQNLTIDDPELDTYIDAIDLIKASLDAVATNQLDVFQNLMSVLATDEYLEDIKTYANIEDETGPYAAAILGANVFIDFYEESEGDVDAIIDEFLTTLNNADVMVMLEITPQIVTELENMMDSYLDDVYTQAQVIKDYDYQNLTTTQEQNVQTFIMALSGMAE